MHPQTRIGSKRFSHIDPSSFARHARLLPAERVATLLPHKELRCHRSVLSQGVHPTLHSLSPNPRLEFPIDHHYSRGTVFPNRGKNGGGRQSLELNSENSLRAGHACNGNQTKPANTDV